jgi:Xaa-Pro aminopeptidase
MIPLLFSKSVYTRRRAKLSENLEANRDLVIFFTAPVRRRNNDATFRFRPDSSFYYLTGYAEPECAFLLWKEKPTKGAAKTFFKIFVLPRDISREQWDGYRYGVDGAQKLLGADTADEIGNLEKGILDWLAKVPHPGAAPRVYTNAGEYGDLKIYLDRVLEKFHPHHRSGKKPLEALIDARPGVEAMRLRKDEGEVKVMREAGRVNVAAHLKVMHELKPGMMEFEVQAIVEGEYIRQGCMDPAYDSICATGANATILHYIENSEKLKRGDLFLIDAGCEYKYYASDITRTLAVGGKFDRKQRQLMDIVADAHAAAVQVARPGTPFKKLHETAEEVLIDGLKSLKLLSGSNRAIREKAKHKRYYPHGTSHWLGHDVHDACPYVDENGESLVLEPGMIFTVEPGLYFLKDDKTVPPAWRGLGVRIEDDVLVTDGDPELLTEGLPRRAVEIEAEMSSGGA